MRERGADVSGGGVTRYGRDGPVEQWEADCQWAAASQPVHRYFARLLAPIDECASAAFAVAKPRPVASEPQQTGAIVPEPSLTSRQPAASGMAVSSKIISASKALSVGFFC